MKEGIEYPTCALPGCDQLNMRGGCTIYCSVKCSWAAETLRRKKEVADRQVKVTEVKKKAPPRNKKNRSKEQQERTDKIMRLLEDLSS